jgi:hypothetical protein
MNYSACLRGKGRDATDFIARGIPDDATDDTKPITYHVEIMPFR